MAFQPLQWERHHDTGIEEIDAQHRCFLALINRLGPELDRCADADMSHRLLEEIIKYAVFHFLSEENLMLKLGYPDFEAHRQRHRSLIEELSWRKVGSTQDAFVEFLTDWFVRHLLEDDLRLGDWARLRGS